MSFIYLIDPFRLPILIHNVIVGLSFAISSLLNSPGPRLKTVGTQVYLAYQILYFIQSIVITGD